MPRRAAALAALLLATPTLAQSPAVEHFEKVVRPLLLRHCQDCHGPDKQRGGLRLDSRTGLLAGGDSGPAVVPGKPEESALVRLARYDSDDPARRMPPKGKLPQADLDALARWVRDGAPWPASAPAQPPPRAGGPLFTAEQKNFWAFRPVKAPVPPAVKDSTWPAGEIDRFILATLEARGLKPARPADKPTLIRRATFDLTGLPPTPEEVAAFEKDDSPEAFAKVVDRLLASPAYGERWGRHWLDVARYADSNGLDENTAFGNAWRYRDYVIDAFNRDKPFDRFVLEQLAGDLLPPTDDPKSEADRLVATGFLVLGPKLLAEPDKQKMVMDIVDEQIDVTGKAFLGLTVSCARCHDHKFDPIPTRDYYSLAGIFKATKTMATLATVARANERPLPLMAADAAALAAYQKRLADAERDLQAARTEARTAAAKALRRDLAKYLLAAADSTPPATARMAAGKPPTGATVVEAEAHTESNAYTDRDVYGKEIGVIHSAGRADAFATYTLIIEKEGTYQVELRYASAESRPVRLLIDGTPIREDACSPATGSFFPDKQQWHAEATLPLKAGKHTLRVEQAIPNGLPHLDKFALVPVEPATPTAGRRPTGDADALARKTGLHTPIVRAWQAYLGQSRADDPVFGPWLALAALPDDGFADKAAELVRGWRSAKPGWRPAVVAAFATAEPPATLAQVASRYARLLEESDDAVVKAIRENPAGPLAVPADPTVLLLPAERERLSAAEAATKTAREAKIPGTPMALAVQDEDKSTDLKVHLRGNYLTLGEPAPRLFPRILAGEDQKPLTGPGSGRLELARWIASPTNPLTARVIVNRVWQHHLGEGIVRSPDNFGALGERPTHPELLDWLTEHFVADGWSLKKLHRRIMLSAVYRQGTAHDADAALADPDNRLLWRFPRRRLEAEAIRDGLLAVAGTLDRTLGGTQLETGNFAYVTDEASRISSRYGGRRRSIYLPVVRNAVYDFFQAFDFVEPSVPNGKRARTTVAPQALWMLNNPFVAEAARGLAGRLLAEGADEASRVRRAYRLAYARPATDAEVRDALEYVAAFEVALVSREKDPTERRRQAWASLCHTLLASNEFVTLE